MSPFAKETVKYAYPKFPWVEDDRGFYFPDAVIDPFIAAIQSCIKNVFAAHIRQDPELTTLNRHQILIPDPKVSWQESGDLVVAAFHRFDPDLAARASDAIANPARWQISQIDPGGAGGWCIPGGNLTEPAIIEYQSDGTVNDSVYEAHELGHLFADDTLNALDLSYSSNKRHMQEVQGYFTQALLYDYLSTHADPALRQAGQQHFIREVVRNLYDIPIGLAALAAENAAVSGSEEREIRTIYETAMYESLGPDWVRYRNSKRLGDEIHKPDRRDGWGITNLYRHSMASVIAMGLLHQVQTQGVENRVHMINALYGNAGPKDIGEVFVAAGITDLNRLRQLADQTIKRIVRPLNDLHEIKSGLATAFDRADHTYVPGKVLDLDNGSRGCSTPAP